MMFPLMRPALAVAGTFSFLEVWNEFVLALILTGPKTKTVPIGLSEFITEHAVEWGPMSAGRLDAAAAPPGRNLFPAALLGPRPHPRRGKVGRSWSRCWYAKSARASGRKAPHLALSNISITAEDGEFLVLLGPSGSGKTTLLRAIAGLEQVDVGDIEIDGRRVNDVDPGQRNVGMVFQDYALYPHLTVHQNIGYSMKLRRVLRADIERRVGEVAAMLGIGELLARRPAELSGGQRQRVAVARAITRDASVLLMDEPLSNLDAQIREHVRVELRELQRRIGVTAIYVTHDQVEAIIMADRIAVMANGAIEQIGTAENVYGRPATLFCARFVGSPKANEIAGSLGMRDDRTAFFTIAAGSGDAPVALLLVLEIHPDAARHRAVHPGLSPGKLPHHLRCDSGNSTEPDFRREQGL